MEVPGPSTVVPAFKAKVTPEDFESLSLRQLNFSLFDSTSSLSITRTQDDEVFYIDGILTEEECKFLRESIDLSPHLSFWSHKGREHDETRAYRNVDTVEVEYHRLANALTDRLKHCLQLASLQVDDSEGRDLVGCWNYSSLNHDCLFSRYPSFGSFAPHTDGKAIHHFDRRSFYSVIIYLNTIPEGCGGGTRFYSNTSVVNQLEPAMYQGHNLWTGKQSMVLHEILPVAGRMLFFKQHLVHEGIPPAENYQKYIIRSDLMYDRDPPLLKTTVDQEAYKLYMYAEQISEQGRTDESIALFRRAIRMSPILAEILGH